VPRILFALDANRGLRPATKDAIGTAVRRPRLPALLGAVQIGEDDTDMVVLCPKC